MASENKKMIGHKPLVEYPWAKEIDRLFSSRKSEHPNFMAFMFDAVMSLAYIDATSGLEKSIERCDNAVDIYNSHLGFINLCSLCYENQSVWQHQKAAKPESGALGRLSSEVILKFIEHVSSDFQSVLAIGGSEYADAIIIHKNGTKILAEVKSAPLITYPLLVNFDKIGDVPNHNKFTITASQLKVCESALYLHDKQFIPLGKIGEENWPFKQFVDFVCNVENSKKVEGFMDTWATAKQVYISKDKTNKMYYLTNACGSPPSEAKKLHGWPQKEVISDSKTSAGMDRTDDIKKGIYQTLKIGINHKNDSSLKTAIISNLPAYRHASDYISPFIPMLWGLESDICTIGDEQAILRSDLRYIFDYIITLENPMLREIDL